MQRQIKTGFLLSKRPRSNDGGGGAEKSPTSCKPYVKLIIPPIANQPMKRSGAWRSSVHICGGGMDRICHDWCLPSLTEGYYYYLRFWPIGALQAVLFLSNSCWELLLLILRNVQVHPVIVTLSWIFTVCNFHPVLLDGVQGHCGKPNSTMNHVTLPYSHVCSQGAAWLVWTATPIKHWETRVGSYESKTDTAVSDSGKLTLLSFGSLWWLFLLDLTEMSKSQIPFPLSIWEQDVFAGWISAKAPLPLPLWL